MKLRLIGHDSRYAMEQLALTLFPQEKIEYVTSDFSGDGAVSGKQHPDCHYRWRLL